jgi:glycosyltransferase involved in cell wall biosynthesis
MRIVAFAYACEPGTGSESGAGWIWSRMLARLGSAWVITRANNREDIENLLPHIPERDRLNFVYVDLPKWARFWKKGKRGARLYYMLWQAAALVEARRLHKEIGFDIAWHLTFSTVWLGSAGSLLGTPFVYGPVGGGVGCPWRLSSTLGGLGVAYEVLRSSARGVGRYLNPWARLAWNKADLILTQNEETRTWFPKRHRRRIEVFPHIVLDEPLAMLDVDRSCAARTPTKTALFAGRLLPWKGTALALHVIDRLPDWRLIICGRGADERRLRRLARRLQIEERVEFRGQVPRDELM